MAIDLLFKEKNITGLIENSTGKLINEMMQTRKDIYYLKEKYSDMLFGINISEDFKYYLGNYSKEKLCEQLKNFNLDNDILQKNHIDLTSSEKRKILLIIGLLSQNKIIIIDNPTIKLDNKAIQMLIKQLKKIKREEKIIILKSYNANFLLEACDEVVIFDNEKYINGNKFDILSNEHLLESVNMKVPDVLNFINIVKGTKKIKLLYRDNINDLVKDIFRYAK